jgi:predicted secreted protein
MQISTGLAIYFLIWWLILFTVLPFGVRSQHESDDVVRGSDPGAPAIPRLGQKLIWTTIVSAIVFAIVAYLYIQRIVTLDGLGTWFGFL